MGKEGFTVWFTGWSGAGKSTLADMLKGSLRNNGVQHIQILDGDIVRKDLTRDLGFSKEDRDENIRRVTFVVQLPEQQRRGDHRGVHLTLSCGTR